MCKNLRSYFSFPLNQFNSIVFLVFSAFATSCSGNNAAKNEDYKATFKVAPVDVVTLIVDTMAIDSFLAKHNVFAEFSEEFNIFYKSREYHGAWFDRHGLIEAAQHLTGHLSVLVNDGILRKLPYREELFTLIDKQKKEQGSSLDLELMLTAQYFNYAKNKWGGAELSKAKDIGWYLPGKKLSYSQLLKKQLTVSAAQLELEAVIPQYIALRKSLNQYQELANKGADVLVPEDSSLKTLVVGDSSITVVKLRARLFQFGDLQQLSSSMNYDQQLADAVLRFKKRHGLKTDFLIDDKFLKEINVPLQSRIEQMMINLERMRWIPLGDHGGKFILVNIPAYQLFYYEENKLTWDCKVVVGKEMSQTVIFGGNLQYVVFSPYWYVPQSIIKKEISPGIKKDANYLSKHHMEWNNGRVRQKPGIDNSLGQVKFIFPNSNDIYLHDTPSKPLFNEDVRAFSHGCIRVEQPKELAKRLLPSWTVANIDKAMKSGKEQWISLKAKVPVYIGYFTAYVDSSGQLNFREDIYKRDQRLLEMLMQ